MIETIKKEWSAQLAVLFFVLMTAWWLFIFLSGFQETPQNYAFAATYGLICLLGGFYGIWYAQKWGGFYSVVGRTMIVLSLGLLFQEFGQIVFSFYNIYLGVEVPYPSLADLGFFGSIPFYIWGAILLAKAAGSKFSLKSFSNQIQAFAIPIFMLVLTYMFFLRGYEVDWTDSLKVFLDFGYPLGEAIYISIAILAYSLSRKILGGVMRNKILFLIGAFIIQYIADFNFLFQSSRGTWINGSYGDYLYFLAYFMMTLGLIQLKTVLNKLE